MGPSKLFNGSTKAHRTIIRWGGRQGSAGLTWRPCTTHLLCTHQRERERSKARRCPCQPVMFQALLQGLSQYWQSVATVSAAGPAGAFSTGTRRVCPEGERMWRFSNSRGHQALFCFFPLPKWKKQNKTNLVGCGSASPQTQIHRKLGRSRTPSSRLGWAIE